jgi:putative transposase
VLGIFLSEERNMLGAEKFIRYLVSKYGRHPVYTEVVHDMMIKHVK